MSEHNKSYPTVEEFKLRFKTFLSNLKKIQGLKDGNVELKLNKFADWTDDEYNKMLGFRPDLSKPQNKQRLHVFSEVELPESINWVT